MKKKTKTMHVGFEIDHRNFIELQKIKHALPPEFAAAKGNFKDFLKLLVTYGAAEVDKLNKEFEAAAATDFPEWKPNE